MYILRKVPLVLLLIVIWAILRLTGVNLASGGIGGIFVICVAILVLMLEFYKSGDISTRGFMRDTAYANLSLIAGTYVVIKLWLSGQGVGFTDVVMMLVIAFDSFVSPVNSFRMALRDMSARVGGQAPE